MKIKQKVISILVISIFVLAIVSFTRTQIPGVKALQEASLTGTITDRGVDVDNNGLFDFLEIGVQVNVSIADRYEVQIGLLPTGTYPPYNYSEVTLSPGVSYINVSINGPWIRACKMNFSSVYYIELWSSGVFQDRVNNVSLSRTYGYSEFDALAYFTGVVIDKGIAVDGGSAFDYLEVDAQISVRQTVWLDLSAVLYDSISISTYEDSSFGPGLQFVNFTFQGSRIYFSKLNATHVNMQMSGPVGYTWMPIDQLTKPLSRTYHYNEFSPHAYLTGKIYDKGIDSDHDGLYDYLQVDVEANVTKTGNYLVSASGLEGTAYANLTSSLPSLIVSRQLYDFQSSGPFLLSGGIHLFNLTFYGPGIAGSEINPANVTDISLIETSNANSTSGQTLEQIQSIPLSRQYDYDEFDHQFIGTQVTFTVNPDGSVAINAMLNETHMYPQNAYGPVVNASTRLSKTNSLILGSANGTIRLPPYVTVPWSYPYYQVQFPTNQTIADYLSQYNNGILTEKLNVTSVLPPIVKTQYPYNTTDFALFGTYSNGMMHAQLNSSSILPQEFASELPFNVTDVTVKANLGNNNEFKGNITLHTISGLPIGDIIVDFEGNRSDMIFTGYIKVLYGTYDGTVVNATNVAKLISEIKSNVTGEGPSSLYNATQGILELTNVEITNTTILGGVRIDYSASVKGDFASVIAKYISNVYFPYSDDQYYPVICAALNATLSSVDDMSFTMAYTHAQKLAQMDISFDSNLKTFWSDALRLIPPTLPSDVPQYATDEINAWLELGNATAYAVQNAWLSVTYSGTEPQPSLSLSTGFVENAAQLSNDTVKLIPDLLRFEYAAYPQLQNITESYLNKTYATLDSCNTTIHLQNSIVTFRTDFAFKGNLDEQLNAAKSYYVSLLNYEYSLMNMTLPTQMRLLNQTSIDINNLALELQYGRDNAFLNVTGIVISPPEQVIDNFRFKLSNFFNVTSGSNEPPIEYEKLRIIIQGGSNSTHTIIPSRSGTVPAPDKVSSDGKTFTWENATISSLRDMIFSIAYQGSYQNGGITYSVPILSNSTVSSFNFYLSNMTISFNVTGTSGTTGFCNITIPRSLLDVSAQNPWVIEVDGVPMSAGQYSVTQNADYTFIYLTYTHSSHKISIIGNISPVQEMPPNSISFIILLVSLIAIILIATQRKKIRRLKAKSLGIADQILDRFSQLLKK
jgi:hypothetical protein